MYEINEERWVIFLAPQLTGNAQRAYAALKAEDATKYPEVKAAILKRYKITEETYQQRFRSDKRKDCESFMELVIRLPNLFQKWMAGCKTVEEVSEKMIIEQFLNTMPSDFWIWIKERKPKSGTEAGQVAGNYLQARTRESGVRVRNSWEGGASETKRCHTCVK